MREYQLRYVESRHRAVRGASPMATRRSVRGLYAGSRRRSVLGNRVLSRRAAGRFTRWMPRLPLTRSGRNRSRPAASRSRKSAGGRAPPVRLVTHRGRQRRLTRPVAARGGLGPPRPCGTPALRAGVGNRKALGRHWRTPVRDIPLREYQLRYVESRHRAVRGASPMATRRSVRGLYAGSRRRSVLGNRVLSRRAAGRFTRWMPRLPLTRSGRNRSRPAASRSRKSAGGRAPPVRLVTHRGRQRRLTRPVAARGGLGPPRPCGTPALRAGVGNRKALAAIGSAVRWRCAKEIDMEGWSGVTRSPSGRIARLLGLMQRRSLWPRAETSDRSCQRRVRTCSIRRS